VRLSILIKIYLNSRQLPKKWKQKCRYRNNILLLKVHDMVPANDSHLFTLW
jgi:hypothetical protein